MSDVEITDNAAVFEDFMYTHLLSVNQSHVYSLAADEYAFLYCFRGCFVAFFPSGVFTAEAVAVDYILKK